MSDSAVSEVGKYARNSGWMLAERVVSMGLGLVTTIVVARYLGPADFGYLNYALSLVALLTVFCNFGLSGLVVKEFRVQPEKEDENLTNVFLIKLATSVVAFAGLCALVGLQGGALSDPVVIVGLALLFIPFTVISDWFQSKVLARFNAMAGVAGSLVSNGAQLVFVYLGLSLIYFAAAHVSLGLVMACALLFFIARNKPSFQAQVSLPGMRTLISKSVLIFLGSVSAIIYLKVDQVMLQHMLGESAVGQYAAAAKLSEAWYFLPTILVTSIYPKIIDASKGSREKYDEFLQLILDVLFLSALVIAVVIFSTSDWLISVVYGNQFGEAGRVLAIHIFASTFVFMRALFSKWIIIEEVFLFSLITQGFGAISNVALNFVLIPEYGINGAAVATVVSYCVAGYLSLVFSASTRPLFFMMTRSICLHGIVSIPHATRTMIEGRE